MLIDNSRFGTRDQRVFAGLGSADAKTVGPDVSAKRSYAAALHLCVACGSVLVSCVSVISLATCHSQTACIKINDNAMPDEACSTFWLKARGGAQFENDGLTPATTSMTETCWLAWD